MEITFYNVSDDPNKLEKNISDSNKIGSARVLAPTERINVLSPIVVIDYDSTNGEKLINANYAYIDTFCRYYWVSCSVNTAGRIVVSGECDYLMSWAAGIKNCPCTIVRAELGAPTQTIDKKLPIDSNRFNMQGIKFPSTGLTYAPATANYIIITR